MTAAKTVCVLTTEGILFEIEASSWVTTSYQVGRDSTHMLVRHAKLYLNDVHGPHAEFSDVHAIWFKEYGKMITEDEE